MSTIPKKCFEGIYEVSDQEVWNVKKSLKKKLVAYVRERLQDKRISNHYSPAEIVTILDNLRDDVLTIGFARRFATYKRATLLFRDLDRLDAIVNNPHRPVQFLFAGWTFPRIPVSSARSSSFRAMTSRSRSGWSRAWTCG